MTKSYPDPRAKTRFIAPRAGSSNPLPSTGESVANSVFAKAGPRASPLPGGAVGRDLQVEQHRAEGPVVSLLGDIPVLHCRRCGSRPESLCSECFPGKPTANKRKKISRVNAASRSHMPAKAGGTAAAIAIAAANMTVRIFLPVHADQAEHDHISGKSFSEAEQPPLLSYGWHV